MLRVRTPGDRRSRWSKTLKQSRFDLWVSHFTVSAPPCYPISRLHGMDYLRHQAEQAREAVGPLARHWWSSVAEVPGVLAEARRQEGGAGSIHWPRPGLVTAFTLCRLGDFTAAESQLRTAGQLDDTQEAGALERLAELAAGRPLTAPGRVSAYREANCGGHCW